MSKTYLKIKIKSLAAEARIIRAEERKWPDPSELRNGLHVHRVLVVRSEARVALLAYGYLRGRAYAVIEGNLDAGNSPIWSRVSALAGKYGPAKVTTETIKAWAEIPLEQRKAA